MKTGIALVMRDFDSEARGPMQKEKSNFEVIPKCGRRVQMTG